MPFLVSLWLLLILSLISNNVSGTDFSVPFEKTFYTTTAHFYALARL